MTNETFKSEMHNWLGCNFIVPGHILLPFGTLLALCLECIAGQHRLKVLLTSHPYIMTKDIQKQ